MRQKPLDRDLSRHEHADPLLFAFCQSRDGSCPGQPARARISVALPRPAHRVARHHDTVYGCLDCGATVSVAELHDARARHLEWHDTKVGFLNQQSDGLVALTTVVATLDEALKIFIGEESRDGD